MAAGFMKKKGVNADAQALALALALSRTDVSLEIKDAMIAEVIPIAESMKAASKLGEVPNFNALVNTKFYQNSRKHRTAQASKVTAAALR